MKTADHLSSSLPAVLKQYVPEYEPTVPVKVQDSLSPRNTSSQKSSRSSRSPGRKASSARNSSRNEDNLLLGSESSDNGQNKRRQSSEAERLEKLSLKWDIAKNDVKQDQHQMLKDKVLLQQQLIKKQDALAQAKREDADNEARKQKELEKAKKQAKEAALLQQCKNSIEEDRRSASKERKSKAKASVTTPPTPSSNVPSSPIRTPSKSRRFHPNLSPVSRTPTNTELLDRDPSWSMPEGEKLQWHQKQLYQVLGKGADYFLHPKIEKKAVKPINSKLRKEGGRAGVDRLLKTLRDESQIRLLKADAHIPQELKDTFGAFVRESVGKDRPPVRRFFCPQEDVPELARLQDHSKTARVRHYKHRVDLMYRASRNNEDRTNILIHNNPPPEVASLDTDQDGVGRYLPSWMDDRAESEPDYMKWVKEGGNTRRDLTSQPIKEDDEDWQKPEEDLGGEGFTDEVILQMSRRKHRHPQPKYIFMKEEDTNVKGTFTDKFRDMYDNADIPRPFNATKLPTPTKSKSVLGLTTEDLVEDRTSCQSAPVPERHRRYYDYISQWEPLSMNALIEYTQKKEAEGVGEYNQGRPKMWSTQVKVT
ncbi:uncharacterized protein LOC128158656 isoform X2 [Crassostrea angulata]|uniref:uncharacterized protein LOC128158656 isoform X2 n=1 Tax=Magallana angulata TaxID=2784310 RepID=UPI0022B13702|nr:uncharacterized protein LOC128158656 isoform X2 [Crassostrea angulata]